MEALLGVLFKTSVIAWKIISSETFITAVSTLAASFGGAYLAFKWQRSEKKSEITERNISAGNRAIVSLIRMFNIVAQYRMQVIDPRRASTGRAVLIAASRLDNTEKEGVDQDSLGFLSGSAEEYELVLDLWIQERRFRALVGAVNSRSDLHVRKIQPAISAAMKPGAEFTRPDVAELVGEDVLSEMEQVTEEIIHLVELLECSIVECKTALQRRMKAHFPGRNVLNFEVLDSAAAASNRT